MTCFLEKKEFAENLLVSLREAKSICLTTHVHPDGDGLCACLALKRILHSMGYQADFVVDDLNLDRYDYLQVFDHVTVDNEQMNYDLVIVIDLHDYQRLGSRLHLVKSASKVIVLDHHEIQNDMMDCAFAWVDSKAVCTGWMLQEIFQNLIQALPAEDKSYVGMCLYTTLLNDTNNFTNANTDKNAYEMAAQICTYGVRTFLVHRLFMALRTPAEMILIGHVLSTIESFDGERILFMHSTLQMLQELGLTPESTSNLSRLVQNLKGVETTVYFREEEEGSYRLSLRSKTINVNAIAVKYDGGGHLQASGCYIKGSLQKVKDIIKAEILSAQKLVN
ncbi:MAG: DHH family phosphoesterase [Candidatus Cloacimonadaceae bacterium]